MGQDFESIADVLPRRYRTVLDALDRIEHAGARSEARRWREAAIARYSHAWDAATLKWMEEMVARTLSIETERELAAARAA